LAIIPTVSCSVTTIRQQVVRKTGDLLVARVVHDSFVVGTTKNDGKITKIKNKKESNLSSGHSQNALREIQSSQGLRHSRLKLQHYFECLFDWLTI
jgi:hypothetical protein